MIWSRWRRLWARATTGCPGSRARGRVHGAAEGSINYTLEWTTDMTFAGKISYDTDGDFSSDGKIPYQPVDCKTVPLP